MDGCRQGTECSRKNTSSGQYSASRLAAAHAGHGARMFMERKMLAISLIISEAEDSGVLGEKKREVRGGMYKIGA